MHAFIYYYMNDECGYTVFIGGWSLTTTDHYNITNDIAN